MTSKSTLHQKIGVGDEPSPLSVLPPQIQLTGGDSGNSSSLPTKDDPAPVVQSPEATSDPANLLQAIRADIKQHLDEKSVAKAVSLGFEKIGQELRALLEAILQQHQSVIGQISPEYLSKEDAATFLGVPVKTIDYLISHRKLRYVQVGDQRGRVIAVEDVREFARLHTIKTAVEMLAGRKRR